MQLKKLNKLIARRSTLIFGTMWMFYAFFVYGLLPLIPSLTHYESQLFYWSGWVQLWALPLLMVGQNVLGEAAEARAIETHDAVMQELSIVKEELALAAEERNTLTDALRLMHLEQRELRKITQVVCGEGAR